MNIEIKPESTISIFQQIIDGIRFAILTGKMVKDDKLPSWRDLAVELRVNPNTVAKAYQELEREGILYVKRGEGTFVADWSKQSMELERHQRLKDAIDQAISTGQRLQFKEEELKKEFEEQLKDLNHKE
jgi:GntR family transcriptional regulator